MDESYEKLLFFQNIITNLKKKKEWNFRDPGFVTLPS